MAATKRSSKKQSSSRAQKTSANKHGNRRWVAGVTTVSTFPPKVHEGRSHHRQVTRFEEGFAQRTRLRNADAYLFHLIARDAASARFGAKCWSGLSESSRNRRKTKDQRTPESGLIGAATLYQVLLSEVNPSLEIATPVFPRHPGCL